MDSEGNSTRSKGKNKQAPKDGGVGNAEENGNPPEVDWRQQMRVEVRAAVSDILAQRESVVREGPSEINVEDVVTSDSVVSLVKRMEAENRSNKTAIRLAGITKEGNKQHFLDMVEIRESAEKAAAALQGSN